MMAKLVGTWEACSHSVCEANLVIRWFQFCSNWADWARMGCQSPQIQPPAAGAREVPRNCLARIKFMSLKDASAGASWADTLGQWCQRSWIRRHITVQFRRHQLFLPCLRNLSQCSRDFLHCACAPNSNKRMQYALNLLITRQTDWSQHVYRQFFGECDLNLTKSWVPVDIPDWPRVYKTYMYSVSLESIHHLNMHTLSITHVKYIDAFVLIHSRYCFWGVRYSTDTATSLFRYAVSVSRFHDFQLLPSHHRHLAMSLRQWPSPGRVNTCWTYIGVSQN